ncbi:ficolin-2-like [Strongylocentrotus purpuratus]|uniref:Fibrinogen C-terminal domain-containing protein n=1 Tax=Strongylocentrotus purpuratus TaxID=7668 RepID=A0A7M7NC88_STRPU|nr:ficolin-2-like [Strongylocentrotus purpuratus]
MTQTCHKNAFGLNYTLPMFNECLQKQHTNGSMVQTIPKLIPVPTVANGCPRRNGKLGIPPGYRACNFHEAPSVMADLTEMSTIIPAEMTQVTATDVPRLPRDCAEIQTGGLSHLSGVHPIYPHGDGGDPLSVYCDTETDGGRWTVFQRRQDGSVDFSLYWSDYKYGFGNVSSEHWLGNDNIHRLSHDKTYELRIDLEDFDGQTRYATYNHFSLADEVANYTLALGSYFGDAGDSMWHHAGYPFSTRDRDHDGLPEHCADKYKGGWWYNDCHRANLNGLYLKGPTTVREHAMGVVWSKWLGNLYSLKKTEMKLRPT